MSERNKKLIESIKTSLDEKVFRETSLGKSKAFCLDSSWTISEISKSLVDDFFSKEFLPWFLKPGQRLLKKDDKLKQFHAFLANLKHAFPIRPLRLSLHTNEYSKDPFFSTFIIDVFRWLEHEQYIHLIRGFSSAKGNVALQTRVCPKRKLRDRILDKLELSNITATLDFEQLIILRNEKKASIPYNNTQSTLDLKKKLQSINNENSKHRIEFVIGKHNGYISAQLHAVFNNSSFTQNGRIYSGALGYQGLPKLVRKTILIDGETTVERDYSAHHPRIMYALKGISYTEDPYKAIFEDIDDKLIKILKAVFLVLINAPNKAKVHGGIFKRLESIPKSFSVLKEKNLTIAGLVKLCKSVHKDIEELFTSNQGFRLANIDSLIALQVVEYFTSQGKACLPVHDSFIVKEEDDQELVNIMSHVYNNVMKESTKSNMDFTCIIK